MPIDSGNLALKGLDDLFSTEENRQEEQREQVQQISIDDLHPFTNHPFKVLDDEKMQDLVESVRINGVLTPVLLRMDDNEEYEIYDQILLNHSGSSLQNGFYHIIQGKNNRQQHKLIR